MSHCPGVQELMLGCVLDYWPLLCSVPVPASALITLQFFSFFQELKDYELHQDLLAQGAYAAGLIRTSTDGYQKMALSRKM